VAGRDELADRYLDALETELSGLGTPDPMATIFIGGGTPTHLAPRQLERLLTIIGEWLPLRPGGEWSIESTPDSLDEERIRLLRDHGVNRISIGVQSFRDAQLHALDRRHSSADIVPAVNRVRRCFDNFSLDLIFGVPGQTLADWRSDLAQATDLEPAHLSCYGLTFEKGTPLWKQREKGQVTPCDEDLERAMFLTADELLGKLGLEHYEVSNYARPGFRSRHNETYWANHAYHGFGLGAARYIQGRRELNTRSLDVYLSRIEMGRSPTIQSEQLTERDRALETITVQLRRAVGINRRQFRQQTGIELDELAGAAVKRMVGWQLLEDTSEAVRFTRQGWCVADAVLSEFWQGSETVLNPTTMWVMPMATPARLDRGDDREVVDID
jgi:oxygen-independent coproporphyrinogen-3 oxidase